MPRQARLISVSLLASLAAIAFEIPLAAGGEQIPSYRMRFGAEVPYQGPAIKRILCQDQHDYTKRECYLPYTDWNSWNNLRPSIDITTSRSLEVTRRK
jgi:hypothetical protein